MDLALKLMLSGIDDNFVEDQDIVQNFNIISPTLTVSNTIFLEGIAILDTYGLTVGDFITTTGAANGANNVTNEVISAITNTDQGDYITISPKCFRAE